MELKIHNYKTNQPVGSINVKHLIVEKVRMDLIQQVITWQLSKVRKPIANTKGVSDVRGSTRKIYRQKGTGGARHGSNRRVQFRGGAVTFGPNKDRNFQTKINKKVKAIALKHSISYVFYQKMVTVFDSFNILQPKTKEIASLFPLKDKKTLFIDTSIDKNFFLSCRNIVNAKSTSVHGMNVLDLMNNNNILISENAINHLIDNSR